MNYSLGVDLFSFLEVFFVVVVELILLSCCIESRLLKLTDGRRTLISSTVLDGMTIQLIVRLGSTKGMEFNTAKCQATHCQEFTY